jgi:hypothetical protein
MTAFITRCCKRLSVASLAVALLFPAPLLAAGIAVEHAELVPLDEAFTLHADFNVDLNAEVEEAVNKGVALNFLVEFALMEPHQYWFDEEVSSASRKIHLNYHALSRQYLVSSAGHQHAFSTLDEAMQSLGRIRDWPVADKGLLKKNIPYYAMLRMRLDHGSLPKPLQVSAIGSEKWDLVSERYRWVPSFEKSSPADRPAPDKSSLDK